jgi:putative ABC transport system permease protein
VGLSLLSSLVAFPLALYLVGIWLDQFVYRVGISVWDILLTAVVDIVIVVATVSYQAVKAASVNPVVSLRYE